MVCAAVAPGLQPLARLGQEAPAGHGGNAGAVQQAGFGAITHPAPVLIGRRRHANRVLGGFYGAWRMARTALGVIALLFIQARAHEQNSELFMSSACCGPGRISREKPRHPPWLFHFRECLKKARHFYQGSPRMLRKSLYFFAIHLSTFLYATTRFIAYKIDQ
ncbi:hypothetical protein GCM10010975_35540 [Comamonas phosphati]|nr:hypothetical protein GCM10010975_35540 [Comamonas phosphati]